MPTDGAVADKRRATPAHYAAAHNRVPVLRHLWSIGAELDAEDCSGKTPLHYAVAGGAKEAVEFLVATAKAWPGAPDGTGDDAPLHLAARSGDVELVKVFLKAVGGGASSELLKDKNKRGLTPLGEALLLPVSSSAEAVVGVEAATDKDNGDKSPVSSSQISKEKVFAMADALSEASSEEGSSPRGWPLLHVLSAAGSAEGVEWLLLKKKDEGEEEKKASSSTSSTFVNERSSEATGSLTPLHAAALGASVKVAELLIAAGAQVSAVDGAGRSPAEAFEAAFAAATKAASAAAAAKDTSATSAASFMTSAPPLPLATAEEARKLRSLLEISSSSVPSSSSSASAAAKKKNSDTTPSSSASSASVEAFSNNDNGSPDSFSFSFESPAATFKALPPTEQLAAARKWSQLDGDEALESATSMFSPAAFEHAKLSRGMRHARVIAQVVSSLHDDEDFQEAAKLKRVKEAVAAVRQDPSAINRFRDDPKTMDVLMGLRKLQAVCAANGRHVVPFEELVVESGERSSKRQEDEDRVAGLGKLLEDHLRAAVAAASEDDPKEAVAAADRALVEARGNGASAAAATASTAEAKPAQPTGLLARAKAVLAAASAEAEAANAAAEAAAAHGEGGGDDASSSSSDLLVSSSNGSSSGRQQQPFDWGTFWRSLTKAMGASLLRAAIAFVVLWMVMKATSPPPVTVVVPPAASAFSATEAEL